MVAQIVDEQRGSLTESIYLIARYDQSERGRHHCHYYQFPLIFDCCQIGGYLDTLRECLQAQRDTQRQTVQYFVAFKFGSCSRKKIAGLHIGRDDHSFVLHRFFLWMKLETSSRIWRSRRGFPKRGLWDATPGIDSSFRYFTCFPKRRVLCLSPRTSLPHLPLIVQHRSPCQTSCA